ncbi:MAG: Stk1 family PASTA domain-containing Ser/Thr kinase [Bifidobacteriaceae bacterium]|jgi:serine/threonine-protein kinase|nr:Stk1 family PASTA domain-containing Ser/Thr kinase [Bifidobacteriaceae bacterium]
MEKNRIFANRYELKELIGSGGMAEVYLAHDRRLNRDVAVKVLRSTLTHDPVFITRFKKEAVASASLNQPNVVSVFDSGDEAFVDEKGNVVHRPFIVMEYVMGKTLKDILASHGKLSVDDSLEILEGVLKALSYSHSKGIVHRDIKPANIMITSSGSIKVMDFGIARALEDVSGNLTQTQAVVGTAQYFSPEQAKGETVDARSDLYSAGCVLYEMVSGVPLFKGDNAVSVAYQHVQEIPELPSKINPDLPKNVENLIMKSIQKNPDLRYQSADDFISDLQKVRKGREIKTNPAQSVKATQVMSPVVSSPLQLNDATTQVQPTPALTKTGLSSNQKIAILIGSIGAALLIAGLVIFFLFFNKPGGGDAGDIEVPNLSVAQTSVQACSMLQDVKLICDLTTTTDPQIADGMFIKQDPAAGQKVKQNSVVKVYFSTGPSSAEIPQLEGKTEVETKSLLEDAGLVLGTVKKEDSGSVYEGQVTRSEPPAGEKLSKGDKVNVWLSTGKYKLPDLTGLSRDEATSSLAGVNIQIAFENQDSKLPEGTVVKQTPKPGSVPQGSTVTLWIAETDDRVVVPTVEGLDRNVAQNTLAELGLVVIVESQMSDAVGSDKAIGTDPVAGTQVEQGSKVTLYISSGPPEPELPIDQTVTP